MVLQRSRHHKLKNTPIPTGNTTQYFIILRANQTNGLFNPDDVRIPFSKEIIKSTHRKNMDLSNAINRQNLLQLHQTRGKYPNLIVDIQEKVNGLAIAARQRKSIHRLPHTKALSPLRAHHKSK